MNRRHAIAHAASHARSRIIVSRSVSQGHDRGDNENAATTVKKEIENAFRSEKEKNEKNRKKGGSGGFAFARLALLAGIIAIVFGGANFAVLSTKVGVALVLFYVFAGGVFDARN